jgi:protein-L-isoaspartate O-methyltransferase
MSTVPEQEGRASDELVRSLLNAGSMTPDWAESFHAVPRSWFLPDRYWSHDMTTGRNVAVSREEDPEEWARQAFADVPIVTQWDDGRHSGPGPGTVPTSSASMPSVVASMLRDLGVHPGMRVLEIGTGTGWNAGLLTHRLGAENVVTLEVDAAVTVGARTALTRAGLHPTVVCTDGALGYPDAAPYNRVIATAGVRTIPPAWLEQSDPGGLILAPFGTHYSNEDALVYLTVGHDGTASGPFLRPVEFMKLRAQRLDWDRFKDHVTLPYPGNAARSSTHLRPADLGDRWSAQRFAVGLAVPDVAHVVNRAPTGDGSSVWLFSTTERAWACAEFPDDSEPVLYQDGPRRLWDEVERALGWWADQQRPPLDSFGLSVSSEGELRPWLADRSNPVPSFA